jgi:epoxyqueuosine reductase QueG
MSPYQDFGWDTAAILGRDASSFVTTEIVKRELVEALGLKSEDFERAEKHSYGELRDEVKAIVQMSRAVEAQLLSSCSAGEDMKIAGVKRKLVGLLDANEAAKRAVGELHVSKKRYVSRAIRRRQYHGEEDEDEKEEEKVEQDEVAVWFSSEIQGIVHML